MILNAIYIFWCEHLEYIRSLLREHPRSQEHDTARRAAGSVRDRDGGAATCEAVMTATYGGDDVSQRTLPSDDD